MNFPQKLQEYRRKEKLSQEDLAHRLGVSRQSVSKWEQGLSFPETEKLIELSTMMGLSIDCLLKDTPEDPVPTTAPSGTPAPEDQPNPAPASALRKHWLTILLILLALVSLFHVFKDFGSPTPPAEIPPSQTLPSTEPSSPPETTLPPETSVPVETEPAPTDAGLRTPDLLELQTWFFDFAREYRLDYLPRFTREDGPPTDSGEYLYWAYTINLDNWGDQKGTMSRTYVDETVWQYFQVNPNLHRSHRKQWGYDEAAESYTAWPDSMRPHPFYLLSGIEIDGDTFTVHATCYTCPYYIERGPQDDLLRQYLLEGSNTELIPTSEITLTFTLDSFVFYEPLFLAYTETVLP